MREWADKMGYESADYFARKIHKTFYKTAYRLIIQAKIEAISHEFSRCPEAKLFTIALDLGFADNAALYKFIKRHTGLTPTDFREQVRFRFRCAHYASDKWECTTNKHRPESIHIG